MCPFSILAFLQPTTVDKEPHYLYLRSILEKLKDFISSVHCKEGHSHQDIDE